MRKDRVITEVLGEESPLSPSDLYTREFKRALVGGYNPNDVDEFLERVADVFESLITQVRELKEQVEEQEARMEEYHEMETSMRSALASSQRFSEDLVEAAKREADGLVREALAKKERIELEMTKMPAEIRMELERLRRRRDRFRAEMLGILDAHRMVLESLVAPEDEEEVEIILCPEQPESLPGPHFEEEEDDGSAAPESDSAAGQEQEKEPEEEPAADKEEEEETT